MQIKKDDFVEAIQVLDLVPVRSGIPSSEIIKIDKHDKGLEMSLASEVLGTVTVKAAEGKFPVPLPFYIDRRLLFPFITSAKTTKAFEFAEKDGSLVLSQGTRKAVLNKLPEVSGYGKIKLATKTEKGDTVKFSDKQKSLVRCAVFCAAKDPSMPQLNCVYLTEKGVVMASNEITVFVGATERFRHSLPFPLFLLNIISNPNMKDIVFLKDRVILEFACGKIMQTLPEKAVKDFPHKRIQSRGNEVSKIPDVLTVKASRMAETFARFKTYLDVVRRQDRVIKLLIEKGSSKMTVFADTIHAKLSEKITLQQEAKNRVEIEWPIDMVSPIIEYLGSQNEIISVHCDKQSPYYIKNEVITLAVARKVSIKGRNYK